MLKIGRIAYANCTPIFHALNEHPPNGGCLFVGGVPSELNAMLAAGKVDVCPSSSIEYARSPGQYLVLPGLSISSIGAVGSVLLFSCIPIEELDGRAILLSSESATSVNLLQILVRMRFGCTCRFSVSNLPLDMALQSAPAMLLIGDAALRASQNPSELLVYDLGKLWHAWTGLPFVFALWLCGRKVAEERHAEVSDLVCHLLSAKEEASSTLESIALVSPETAWMGRDRLVSYWRDNISYDLGTSHLEGLSLFYRYCRELGLLANEPEINFFTCSRDEGN